MFEKSHSRNPERTLGMYLQSSTARNQPQDEDQAQSQGLPRTPHRLSSPRTPQRLSSPRTLQTLSSPRTPTHDYTFEDDPDHFGKKSILLKIKDKAKKWKQLVTKKKHSHQENSTIAPPQWAVTSYVAAEDEQPEKHAAPRYESERAPEVSRESATLSPRTVRFCDASNKPTATHEPFVAKKTALVHGADIATKELEMKEANDRHKQESGSHIGLTTGNYLSKDKLIDEIEVTEQNVGTERTLTQTVTEMTAPIYSTITSRMQESVPRCKIAAEQLWNKSVMLKETLMHKLEPKEEDKSLCQCITEAVTPRSKKTVYDDDDGGAWQMLREMIHSSVSQENQQTQPIPVSTHPCSVEADGTARALMN